MPQARRPPGRDAATWAIDDEPAALRRKGTSSPALLLSETGPATLTVGSASVRRDRAGWWISPARADTELRRDGIALPTFRLLPGVEVGIDRTVLIAESRRLRELTRLIGHLIGLRAWPAIDHALRLIREAVCARRTLVLCGDQQDALVDAARRLHRLAVGRGELVVCTDHGREPNLSSARAALARAGSGTVCLVDPVPRDLSQMLEQWRASSRRTQLILCSRELHPIDLCLNDPITLVPLKERPSDRRAIVDHFVTEAIDRFEAKPDLITAFDRIQLANSDTLEMIEVAATRLVAVRHFGGVTRAAVHLGVSHGAVVRYFARRGIIP